MAQRLKFFLFLLLWGSAPAMARDPFLFPDATRVREVAHSPEWLRLLHYRKPFLRANRSDVDDPTFFLAKGGASDPEAELRANLQMFLSPALGAEKHAPMNQPTACAFPARLAFLKRAFGPSFEAGLPPLAQCPDFSEWRKGIRARGVSLVFSSAYPNNPASMFGHTFLRLDRSRPSETTGAPIVTKEMDLLSYGVNFSATVSADENPVKYAIWGLVGGYTGRYDLSPYYRKVNEYAFSESRDLWEYRLSMTEEEVAQLVRHVWELYAQGGLDYYFLDENCSFQILTALEAVKPDWNLSSAFVLSVLPVETVKHVVDTKGAVAQIGYRPSLRNQMAAHLERLSSPDREAVSSVFRGKESNISSLSTSVLDTLISVLAYEKERIGKKDDRLALQRTILLERSRRGKSEGVVETAPMSERPDLSHSASRVSLTGGSASGKAVYGASLYGFRHDFLDRTPSYNLFSEVRLFSFRGEKREDHTFRFQQADLLAMASFAPHSEFDAQKSWRLGIDWTRIEEAPDSNAGEWRASGGYGFGVNVFGAKNLAYALASGELEKSGIFRHGFRFSPGAEFGLVLNPVANFYFVQARAMPSWDAASAALGRRFRFRGEVTQSLWLTNALDFRLNASVERSELTVREWQSRLEAGLGWRF